MQIAGTWLIINREHKVLRGKPQLGIMSEHSDTHTHRDVHLLKYLIETIYEKLIFALQLADSLNLH